MTGSLRLHRALAILVAASLPAQHNLPDRPARRLPIHICDLASTAPQTIEEATHEAARVLATAGVDAVWRQIPPDSPEAHMEDQSAEAVPGVALDGRGYLVVRIVRGRPAWVRPDALGYALPNAQSGAQATIFYDRVEPLGHANEISVSILLGDALAHEIGHVLLGGTDHAPGGIMKARWGKADFQYAAMGLLAFNSSERTAIWERLSVQSARQIGTGRSTQAPQNDAR